MFYLFCKWLHIVAVISWMAGILYLYRLLIYLAERGQDPNIKELLVLMASRLYRIITLPAMVVTFIAGLGIVWSNPALAASGWFGLKFLCVLGVMHFTIKAGLLIKRFDKNAPNLPTSRRLRLLNEVPTLLMIMIVWLVVFKPF